MSKVALVVDLTIAPGKLEQFLERAARHAQTCLAREPGCQRFDILVPQDGGDRVILYELYADEVAVEAHRATPHMAEYLADTKAMIAERVRTACTLVNE